ncbi:MAG TPA: type II secretion system F family protein [Candidatus Nanoarchaeia archaeon]|nr:type II secretion system F family protein [Candidatus Nanoarchaeia archaeon]
MNSVKIPFSLLPPAILEKGSRRFLWLGSMAERFFPFLRLSLLQSELGVKPREYLALCILSTLSFFFAGTFVLSGLLLLFRVDAAILVGLSIMLLFSAFIFIEQVMYPRVISSRRIKDIDQNLLPALRTMLIHVNSGVPLFEALVSIANEQYGAVSLEFKKAVKAINAGIPEVESLEKLAEENPSFYFRRAIWQIVNGITAGSQVDTVLKEVTHSISQEQTIQIETYGSQLNPLAMFYMIIAVIIPALGMTFMVIISSFIALSESGTKIMFWGMYAFVIFFQIMFLGLIRTKRPNLIGG